MNGKEQYTVICLHNITKGDIHGDESDVDELALLAETLGWEVKHKIVHKVHRINSASYIGSGQLEEIKELVEKEEIKAVLFDNELSPSQFHFLEAELNALVFTRTEVILQIFSMRAKTKHAKLQVELAYLEFDQPRLKGRWTHFSRQRGGGNAVKGMGETQLEIDRRRGRERMTHIKKELAKLEKSKSVSRGGRRNSFRVALVGYTNAGKSSLFNLLVKEHKYVENKLFATLDTFTRKLYLGYDIKKDVLISDTVGFIKNLPHGLVESFKSTLAEVAEADVLLHVVDAAKEDLTADIESVEKVLSEFDSDGIERVLVFNKIDLLDELEQTAIKRRYPNALFISVKDHTNIDGLKKKIRTELIESGYEPEPFKEEDYN